MTLTGCGVSPDTEHQALVAAVAVSLYGYNVAPLKRAKRLHDDFSGDCMDLVDLVETLTARSACWATELPMPTARLYLHHAIETYGAEAQERVDANLGS